MKRFLLDAVLVRPEGRTPIQIRISDPIRSMEGGAFCLIAIEPLYRDPFKVVGDNEGQAARLSRNFWRQVLDRPGWSIETLDGKPIELPPD